MSDKKKPKRKLEPKFGLDMDFAEALERFAQTNPKEVADSIERAKQKKPPGDDAPRRPPRTKRKASSSNRDRQPKDD